MNLISPATAGLDSDALSKAVAFAMASGTAQLQIRHRKGIVANEVATPDPVDVFAVQKGLLCLLLGIAEEQYLLETIDPVNHHLDPEWTKLSPWDEAKLTIEILLTMTTGMDDELGPLGEVGKSWRYNNTAYNYLKEILELHTGKSLNEVTRTWLLEPLGMNDTAWVDRNQKLPNGRPFTGLVSTASDLARLGMLVLDGGEGRVPSYFIDRLARPGSEENPAWGLCWWNNNQSTHRLPMREEKVREGVPTPAAPRDMISARGAFENMLYVVPGMELVIARTATPAAAGERPPAFDRRFWELLLERC